MILVVVRQNIECRQDLKPPRVVSLPITHDRMSNRQKIPARRGTVRVQTHLIEPFQQELEGAGPISLVSADISPFRPIVAAVEFARDDRAEMLRVVQIAFGRRLEHAPALLVDRDDRLTEGVDFVVPPELRQTFDGFPQITPGVLGVGLLVEREAPVALVGILVVSRRE